MTPEALNREVLEQQREALNREVLEHKRAIRFHKQQLHGVAAARRRLIRRIQQFGIEVVELVDEPDPGQGVERESHGQAQDEDEAAREEANR